MDREKGRDSRGNICITRKFVARSIETKDDLGLHQQVFPLFEYEAQTCFLRREGVQVCEVTNSPARPRRSCLDCMVYRSLTIIAPSEFDYRADGAFETVPLSISMNFWHRNVDKSRARISYSLYLPTPSARCQCSSHGHRRWLRAADVNGWRR